MTECLLFDRGILDILLDHQGHPKLSDFGAAKILAKNQKTMGRTTMNMNVNSLAGTPMYMVCNHIDFAPFLY